MWVPGLIHVLRVLLLRFSPQAVSGDPCSTPKSTSFRSFWSCRVGGALVLNIDSDAPVSAKENLIALKFNLMRSLTRAPFLPRRPLHMLRSVTEDLESPLEDERRALVDRQQVPVARVEQYLAQLGDGNVPRVPVARAADVDL